MALIDNIKQRIGVFYSDAQKDADVQSMIDEATLYFKGGGWDIGSAPDALATGAIALYIKMAQSTDPAQLTNHPVLLSYIAQGRAVVSTVATPTATPEGGAYAGAQIVALACSTLNAKIYYTTDGTTPTEESSEYYTPILITASTTLKAVAIRYGWYDSAVLTEAYVIGGI